MSAVARPLVRESYSAWLTTGLGLHNAAPLPLGDASSLEDAMRLGEQKTSHKGVYFVRRETEAGVTLHFYAVKQQSKPIWRRAGDDVAHVAQFRPLYSEHLFDLGLEGLI